MGYIAELWKTTKSGKYKGIPRFYKQVPIDNVSSLHIGEVFTIVYVKTKVRYYIERIEHVYYNKPRDEYFVRYFIRRV